MEKREDAQIYILTHKPIDYQREDSLYTPLQVGFNAGRLCPLRDNVGFEISNWNQIYAEVTGIYWVWRNRPENLKYIGVCQYRRRLEFEEDTDFDKLFQEYDVVTMTPIRCVPERQFAMCHCREDLELAEGIVKERYPDLAGKWDRIMKLGSDLLYSNGMVMPAESFDHFCSFLFDVLEEFKGWKGWDTPNDAIEDVRKDIAEGRRRGARGLDYQAQVFGFLTERLWTFWCLASFPRDRILFLNYRKFEGV